MSSTLVPTELVAFWVPFPAAWVWRQDMTGHGGALQCMIDFGKNGESTKNERFEYLTLLI